MTVGVGNCVGWWGGERKRVVGEVDGDVGKCWEGVKQCFGVWGKVREDVGKCVGVWGSVRKCWRKCEK